MTDGSGDRDLDDFLRRVRACTACADLPLGPRPILHISRTARILIASQAPGTRVHETGISFNDASGDRLRGWLGIDRDTFYDTRRIALAPMGMCYPGRLPKGGDRPPRPECAPLWRDRILAMMPDIRLTLLVGSYAQAAVLGPGRVEDRVRNFRDVMPRYFPLPHPSWRTGAWERRTPWFATDVLPALRAAIRPLLAADGTSG
ncbi:uracil-DNA glycosylase [Gluconacetobacter johannae DSM 13595]|uniref:Uracil-DNA glycosylase family protein n=1 Tax=Gluconacetobacter johannae TaxID=112140 RepID=A0A7W4J4Q0_9PROT|nr:uracil-DNA glycosylase family protein [Gluconacetobacter johannae]MBB2174561.1 uracil-DNA glycosylase family protein [Gluconacetobacter johannae]GBQ84417.1 uracil-DNA glycosylase [Gluconacetobacter johannae DSM 13595]